MPQITKARIVNFNYNKGARIIADETFNFLDSENKYSNALINLANGGGKSVLVQLLMQPVAPLVNVNKRKISDNLRGSNDHFYVLLEWGLDNSDERLLTGISISAGEKRDVSEDSGRGISVNYYTFVLTYNKFDRRSSIENLQLSEIMGNAFVPAPYDKVRVWSKTNKQIEVFSKERDDKKRYSNRLAEYGVFQDEWKGIISQINSDEGGVSKYFEEMARTDQVLDKFFIKAITNAKNTSLDKNDDSSLNSMVKSYAKMRANQKHDIDEKENLERYAEFGKDIVSKLKERWDQKDRLNIINKKFKGFFVAVEHEMANCEKEKERLNLEFEVIDEEKSQLKFEKKSSIYHSESDKLDKVVMEYDIVKGDKIKLDTQIAELKNEKDIQDCGKIYAEIRRLQDKNTVNQEKIEDKIANVDNKEKIGKLKYSLKTKLIASLEDLKSEVENIDNHRNEVSRTILEVESKVQNRIKEKIDLSAKCNKTEGRKDTKHESLEKQAIAFDELSIHLAIELISNEHITLIEKSIIREEKPHFEFIENFDSKLGQLNKQKAKVIECQKKTTKEMECNETKKIEVNDKIESYNKKELNLQSYLNEYNLNIKDVFSTIAVDTITELKNDEEQQLKLLERENYIYIVQKRCANNGNLHIDESIIKQLDDYNINYTTCESYLNNNKEIETNLVLANYPSVAYGIIIDDKSLQNFITKASWIPSFVPVFTYDDLTAILKGEYVEIKGVSHYENKYFENKNKYLEDLDFKIENSNREVEICKNRVENLMAFINLINDFDFDENYKFTQMNFLSNLECENKKYIQQETDLNEKVSQLETSIFKHNEDKYSALDDIRILKEKREKLHQFAELLELYKNFTIEIKQYKKEIVRLELEIKEADENLKSYNNKKIKLNTDIADKNERISKYKQQYNEVENATPTNILNEDIDTLITKLEQMTKEMGEGISQLKDEIEKNNTEISEKSKELSSFPLNEQEYINIVYSSNQYLSIKAMLSECELELINTTKNYEAKRDFKSRQTEKVDIALTNLGERLPLDRELIKFNFENRLIVFRNSEDRIKVILEQNSDKYSKLRGLFYANKTVLNTIIVDGIIEVVLENDFDKQHETLLEERLAMMYLFKNGKKDLVRMINQSINKNEFSIKVCTDNLKNMLDQLSEESQFDMIYSLIERNEKFNNTCNSKINILRMKIQKIEDARENLIYHCYSEGKYYYDELRKISLSSKVKLPSSKTKLNMIKILLPDDVNELASKERLRRELEIQMKILVDIIIENKSDVEVDKCISKIVEPRKLLNQYIGMSEIDIEVYKIDINTNNSEYRKWEKAFENSGGEKFLVYLSCILPVMSYTRKEKTLIDDKFTYSLILDNPFGAITSKHLLKPMFEIAKHFGVQLICLSDISKSDVVNCFNVVIRAVVKNLSLKNKDRLVFNYDEEIKQGNYNTNQTSMF